MPIFWGGAVINISFVICAYNDFDNFVKTILSLIGQIKTNDEIVVIDSSSSNMVSNYAKSQLTPYLNYCWVEPAGVYSAQNLGLRLAKNDWIQIINSGDTLINEGLEEARKLVLENRSTKIHVFQQKAILHDFSWVYAPEESSVWPHQSIICHKDVYDTQGFYDETYSLVSDQLFFFEARKTYSFKIYNFVLTVYPLNGLSTQFSLKYMTEKYVLLRINNNLFRSFVQAFPLSCIVFLLNNIFGAKLVYRTKFAIRNVFRW